PLSCFARFFVAPPPSSSSPSPLSLHDALPICLDLMLAIFQIVQGMVSTVINQSGVSGMSAVTLPQDLVDAINQVGFWDSIPLWADRKSTRLNSSHVSISYAVFCLKKKITQLAE